MDDTHVEQNLGRIGNLFKVSQRFVEFIVVVPREGGDPRLYFLQEMSIARLLEGYQELRSARISRPGTKGPTCFNDMAAQVRMSWSEDRR